MSTVYIDFVQEGATPLWTASFYGHHKCMELLIDAGANVDVLEEVSVSIKLLFYYNDCVGSNNNHYTSKLILPLYFLNQNMH